MNRYVYSVTNKVSYWLSVGVAVLIGYAIEKAIATQHGIIWIPNAALIVWILAELYWSVRDLARRRTA